MAGWLRSGCFLLAIFLSLGFLGWLCGYEYYPNFNFSNVTCYEAIPGSSRGSFSDPKSVRSCNAEFSLSTTSSQVASCSNSNPPLPLSKPRTTNRCSQYSTTPAIRTCSSIVFQKGTFLDSAADSVSGSTGFGRSTTYRTTNVEGTTSTSSALPSDVRVSSRIDDPYGYVDSDVQNSRRIPVADYSSVGPLGFVVNDVPTDFSFPTDRPSVSTPALSRGSFLTATALRVTSPSRSTPDIASILRTLAGLGSLALRVDLPSVAEEGGGGQALSTGQSGSTLSGHGHVRVISQISRATSHNSECDPDQALSERSLSQSLEESQSHEPAINYHETLEEVYSLLGDLCPQADQTQDSTHVRSLLESILDQPTSSKSTLPQSSTVNQLMGKLFDNTAEARSSPNWYVPRKIIDSLTRPHSYVCHTEFWPSNIPTLDADAGRLGISVGRFASIPVTLLEYLERLAKRGVAISSYCDFFGSAAFQALCAEHVDPDVLRCLLLAVNCSTKHSMALGLLISAMLLHHRHNAALDTSQLLLSHNKDNLRADSLNSSLFLVGK